MPSDNNKKSTTRRAILCDFDGTVSPIDTTMLIYATFAGPGCLELNRLWDQGKVTTIEEATGCFETIHATPDEIEAVLDTVSIDPDFQELSRLCGARGDVLAILSDGFAWYIEHILQRHGIDRLSVFANQIAITSDGYEISFPWHNPCTPRFGTSKGSIIRGYQAGGYQVVFIGDGLSDTEAVHAADAVFAKGLLFDYCQQQCVPAIPFSTLSEVIPHLFLSPPE